MLNDHEMDEITQKLSGIILRKAELEKNFDMVYSQVFERIQTVSEFEGDEFLFLLGEIGG